MMREYLGEIYRLQSTPEGATTSLLAERLEVSPSAVVRMLRRLAEAKMLTHVPYKGVTLTPAGEREALKSIRRHRLLEVFLVKVMGFGWEEVHAESHGLQLTISEAFEDRMDAVCGYPTHCPHGDPIPTKDGRIAPTNDQPLTEVGVGASAVVRRVKTDDAGKLRYLAELGLVPGTPIHVVNRAPFNGPLRLQIGAGAKPTEHVIGTEIAQVVRVEVVK
ncbi:MAG: metal-dependent transcriptional regulator [Anaerolineales bacterium]|nr:metal-dependent transcriptional regulator [Anaerolineales bacterium]